jgi:aspartyl-tRNA(Asn)/glutamyl-tRNA(Gln) amidotransferase subunit A
MPLSFSQDHVGPLTRTVEDAALMLQAIAGHDPDDPTTSPRKVPNFLAELEKGARGCRVALAGGWFLDGADAEVAAGMEAAVAVYRKLGARVSRVEVPSLDSLNAMAMLITGAESASYHARWLRERPQDYGDQIRQRIQQGAMYPAVRYLEALRLRQHKLDWFVKEMLGGADALLAPVLSFPVPTIAETDVGGDHRAFEVVARVARLTRPANYLGLPAVSAPCGFTRNGLPLGMQLIGRPFAEARLIRLARAFERETGYAAMKPPNCWGG